MGRSSYKRLGDYIQLVDIRNKDNAVENLVGLTIDKVFIDSVANTIGTDLSKYKIIEAEQFACSLMQVSRDNSVPIAMYTESEKAILSPAYPMFEVIDKSKLLPSYLMMWFRRPEFDREASFYAVGGVRGSLLWDDFLDFRLPIPDIEVQREIVAQYETITRRIALNERICSNLEETAQALYNKMFVQDIDPDDLPDGWRIGTLGDIATFKYGKQTPRYDKSEKHLYPVFSGYTITGYSEHCNIFESTIVIIARGNSGTGEIRMTPSQCFLSNLAISIVVHKNIKDYLYHFLSQADTKSLRSGSAQAQITIGSLEQFEILLPPDKITLEFKGKVKPISEYKAVLLKENEILTNLMDLYINNLNTTLRNYE